LFWQSTQPAALPPAALEIKPTVRCHPQVDNRQLQSKPAQRDVLLRIVETDF
jgi:hypothetical protein